MKKHVIYEIAIVLVAVLALTGTGYAGLFDSKEESNPESSQPGMTDQDRAVPEAGDRIGTSMILFFNNVLTLISSENCTHGFLI